MSAPSYQKLALIFGCDYYGANKLHGCINDANDIKNFLLSERGFDASNVITVYDKKMTRNNMLKHLEELAAETHAIVENNKVPAVFLYYSGHGVQVPDTLKIEADGAAEALVPYDFEKSDLILDHELFDRFIKKLHAETDLFLFTDCCNSGTNFNLAYTGLARAYEGHAVDADVIGLSGCSDDQTSAEIEGHGLATAAFLKAMRDPRQIASMDKFRRAMADVSIPGHVQTPQVSVSKEGLLRGQLFSWLLVDDGTRQLTHKELKRLVKKPRGLFGFLKK